MIYSIILLLSKHFFNSKIWICVKGNEVSNIWNRNQFQILGSLSTAGFVFGILGSLSLSLFSIFTKKVLPKVNGEVWALSYANNVYASILLIPMMIFNKELQELINYSGFSDHYFWFITLVGGICGFMIGFFTTLQIKVNTTN